MSEYPPDTKIKPSNFVLRDRIIAGLSSATLVIEAGLNSGALITANQAFSYNRKVFACPGSL